MAAGGGTPRTPAPAPAKGGLGHLVVLLDDVNTCSQGAQTSSTSLTRAEDGGHHWWGTGENHLQCNKHPHWTSLTRRSLSCQSKRFPAEMSESLLKVPGSGLSSWEHGAQSQYGAGVMARVSSNAAETPWLHPSWLLRPSKG